jgi:hypothetical protein
MDHYLDDHEEVRFREGKRWVPGYLARQLPDEEELLTMTYAEAMAYINRKQFENWANDAQQRVIDRHFREGA